MPSHVALLRGINVGGKNKLPMASLRALVADLGYTDVATYVQSGNVVFTAGGSDATLEKAVSAAILDTTGLTVPVLVRTAAELRSVLAANPYPDAAEDKLVHAIFLPVAPSPEFRAAVAAAQERADAKGSTGTTAVVDRTLFVDTPDGFGTSKLVEELGRGGKSAPLTGTTGRNLRTLKALVEMLG